MKILVVDDEESVRLLVKLTLEKVGGMRVIEAPDGLTALAVANEEQPDAILLDCMMPGLDGPATLARLREFPRTCRIPVILHTAHTLDSDADRLLGLGAAGVLGKPFDVRRLPDQIREIVGSPAASATSTAADAGRLETALAPYLAAFRSSLPERIERIRESLQLLADAPERGDLAAPVEKLCHRLAGTAGSHGLDRIGEAARSLELAIRGLAATSTGRKTRLLEAQALCRELEDRVSEELTGSGSSKMPS